MNYKKVFCLLFFFLTFNVFPQNIIKPYEVATWQGFKSGAITFTFDDNTPNQISIVLPMFNEYGYKMTFFPVINWGPNWAALQAAAQNGHEVGSHTVSHPGLNTLSTDQQTAEYKNSQDAINAKVTAQKCLTIAYPNCVTGNVALLKQYFIAGRICSGTIIPKNPSDFMNLSSFVCGSQSSIQRTSDFTAKFDAAASSNGWLVLLIHAIDSESGYSPTSSAQLKGALDYIKTNDNKFWVSTFGNVARYIKERNSISISESVGLNNNITVKVTDTLDNSIYNVPLTIRRPIPDGWTAYELKQNGSALSSQLIESGGVKYITFDVVPDAGDIILSKSSATDIKQEKIGSVPSGFSLDQNYPNPFNPSTTISYSIKETGFVSLKVFDTLGKEVATLVEQIKQPGIYFSKFSIQNSEIASGVYFYTLRAGNYFETKKMMLVK